MTLCIATRSPNQILVTADSRLSFGEETAPVDSAVKISAIHARVFPWHQEGVQDIPDFDRSIGIAVVGSGTTASIIRELLRALLFDLQYPAGVQELSLLLLCGLVRNLFQSVSTIVCQSLAKSGLGQVLLVGFCPKALRPRAFLFNIHATPDSLVASYDEVLTAPGRLCLGSGAPAAEALYASNHSLSQFHVLKHVIDDPTIPSVGGPIQCGQFVGPDFVIRGIEDFTVDPDSEPPSMTIQYFVAGMPIYKAPLEGGWDAFPYRQAFLQPFKTEIDAYIDRDFVLR